MNDVLPDIPRLATALAEWMACLVYVLVLPRRWGWPVTGVLLLAGLAGLGGIQLLAAALPLGLWVLGMLCAVAGMGALIAAVSRVGYNDVGYVTARAFVLAELVASFAWQLHTFYLHPGPSADSLSAAVITGLYLLCFGAAAVLERRHFRSTRGPDVGPRTLSATLAIAAITFALSNLSFVAPNTPFSGEITSQFLYIRTLVDLCGYIALYAQHEQLRKTRADLELAAMNAMLRTQHDLYRQAQRDAETLARVRHDLKHQLAALRMEQDSQRRAGSLEALEATINAYIEIYDTGNPVLDTMLTAKARFCKARDINFTCVADGSRLGFVDPMDLASLLGNALDNAVESVQRLTETKQRLIRVAVFNQAAFVVLRFENYFDGELRYEAGQLATRKANRVHHGLGIKSINHTAAKYGGVATVTADESWFTLMVLLPAAD